MEIILTTMLETLEAEVLKLPVSDRSRLLERVLASLDTDEDLDAAWDTIADKREAEIEADEVVPVPVEEAVARLEACFPM